MKLLKADIAKGGEEKKRMKSMHDEAVHLRAGGRSRINLYSEQVVKKEERIHDLIAPEQEFWLLEEYEEEFGKASKTGATVVKRRVHGHKGKQKGVYVQKGRKGVYTVRDTIRSVASKQEVRHNGQEVLDDGEMNEVMDDIEDEKVGELELKSTVLTAGETRARAAVAKLDSDSEAIGGRKSKGDDGSDDSSNGPSSSGSSESDSGDAGSDDSLAASSEDCDAKAKPKIKRARAARGSNNQCKPEAQQSTDPSSYSRTQINKRSKSSLNRCANSEDIIQNGIIRDYEAVRTALSTRLASLQKGEMDSTRGRAAQRLMKEWQLELVEGRRVAKAKALHPGDVKEALLAVCAKTDKVSSVSNHNINV